MTTHTEIILHYQITREAILVCFYFLLYFFPDLKESIRMKARSPTHRELCGSQRTLPTLASASPTPKGSTAGSEGPPENSCRTGPPSLPNMRMMHSK